MWQTHSGDSRKKTFNCYWDISLTEPNRQRWIDPRKYQFNHFNAVSFGSLSHLLFSNRPLSCTNTTGLQGAEVGLDAFRDHRKKQQGLAHTQLRKDKERSEKQKCGFPILQNERNKSFVNNVILWQYAIWLLLFLSAFPFRGRHSESVTSI